jgi:DGQHR domain-containing protein
MTQDNYIKVKCIEVKQPIGVFYIATIEWYDINNIARADIRRIEKGEGGKVETYLGMQRRLSDSRVKEISQYVQNIDATFPTGIILHINSFSDDLRNVIFDKEKSEMQIRVNEDVATILDGQHRIEGLKKGLGETGKHQTKFQLNVSIFVDLDMDNQSMVFATVNKAQTKVNKSLVYDLFAFANTRSPQRTAHNIVRLMDESEKSPFYKMVKILGTADDPDRERITQATIAEAIIKYISKNPMTDRDRLKRNKT